MNYIFLYSIFVFFLLSSTFGDAFFVTKEIIWDLIKSESKRDSSSPSSRVVRDVEGPCPDTKITGATSTDESIELCIELIMSVVRSCKGPNLQAEYILFKSKKQSLKIPGLRTSTHFVVHKLIVKFCRLAIANLQVHFPTSQSTATPVVSPSFPLQSQVQVPAYPHQPSPHSPSPQPIPPSQPIPPPPPFPSHSSPSRAPLVPPRPSVQLPTPTYLASTTTSHSQKGSSPLSAEWNKMVNSALYGVGSKYISSIPSSPYPTFKVGKDNNEKFELCIKTLRDMVSSSMSTLSLLTSGSLVFRVETVSDQGTKSQESLIIRASSDNLEGIKDKIKRFCSAVYSVEGSLDEKSEWEKIYRSSLTSDNVKSLPKDVPTFYRLTVSDTASLYDSCVEVLKTLFESGTKTKPSTGSGISFGTMTISGKYPQLGGSVTSYSSSVSCRQPYSDADINEAIKAFCREVYSSPAKEPAKNKEAELLKVYGQIQVATSRSNSIFGRFPHEPPSCFLPFLSSFSLDEQGFFPEQVKVEICKKLLNAIWDNSSSKNPVQTFRVGPGVAGISPNKVVKLGIRWSENIGYITINFPFIDTDIPRYISMESVSSEFCQNIFAPKAAPIYPTLPTIPVPASQPLPLVRTPQEFVHAPDKYSGRRPPPGYPNYIPLMHVMVQHPGSTLLLKYSRRVWSRLYQHSTFGIGSASISGLGVNRHVDFLTSSRGEALYNYCYNVFASFYNTATYYKISGDGKRILVEKDQHVDLGKDSDYLRTGIEKVTLVFILPGQGQSQSSGQNNALQQLIKMFCKSFINITN